MCITFVGQNPSPKDQLTQLAFGMFGDIPYNWDTDHCLVFRPTAVKDLAWPRLVEDIEDINEAPGRAELLRRIGGFIDHVASKNKRLGVQFTYHNKCLDDGDQDEPVSMPFRILYPETPEDMI